MVATISSVLDMSSSITIWRERGSMLARLLARLVRIDSLAPARGRTLSPIWVLAKTEPNFGALWF